MVPVLWNSRFKDRGHREVGDLKSLNSIMTQLSLSYWSYFPTAYYFCSMSIEVKNLLRFMVSKSGK
jgi:hypothetical protein